MSSSVKRFELFRMLFAIAIALLVPFGIIFLVSSQPLTAIYTLITGPFKSRRNFANVIEAMIPLIFTGTGVCIMFSANQINLAGEGAFHIGGLVSAVVATGAGSFPQEPAARQWRILLLRAGGCGIHGGSGGSEDQDKFFCACILADAQLSRTVVCNIYSHAFYL